jgi:D-alanyl-lipoteichoic acid acyltransferase DltB (MBOAT superfamily)
MSFVHLAFLWFFPAVLLLYWTVRSRVSQNIVMLVASAVFYGWIHPWFLLLIYGSTVLDWTCGLGMVRHPHKKKAFLVASLVGNLGLLGVFKYLDFFIINVMEAADRLGIQTDLTTLGIFLPVGISFYTFQSLSYTIDIYRGKLRPRESFLDFSVFVTMFPQLVAGPVERARNLLVQVEIKRHFDTEKFCSGLSLALWGAFKKLVIADTVAMYVDTMLAWESPGWPVVWAAAIGFAIQILADFSGYTDMARGTARMLGFELMENFKSPYLAASPGEFWKRWHISFSSWIHEYLYLPLRGTDRSAQRRTLATYGALLLSGLWHGASWNFVIWGAFHASLLWLYRQAQPRVPSVLKDRVWSRPLAICIMFAFTCCGWLIFRQTDLSLLLEHLSQNPMNASSAEWTMGLVMLSVVALGSIPLLAARIFEDRILPRLRNNPWFSPLQAALWGIAILFIIVFARDTANDFIYFQF